MPISKRQMKNAITKIASNDDKALIVEALVEIIGAKFNGGVQSDWEATKVLRNHCDRQHKDVEKQAEANGNLTITVTKRTTIEPKPYIKNTYARIWNS